MRQPSLALALVALVVSASAAYGQTVTSTFDKDTEAWEVRGFSYTSHLATLPCPLLPSYDASSGQPAGSLRVTDVCSETAMSAPVSFLGDKAAYFGGQITYDILIRLTDDNHYPAILLRSPTTTLFYFTPSPVTGVWESRVVPLTAPGWTVNSYAGPPATIAEMREVLGDLENLLIVTEWKTGSDDTNVDIVALRPPSKGAVAYGQGCALSSGVVPGLWVEGLVTGGSNVSLMLDGGLPNGFAFLGIGLVQTSLPLGSGCDLLIAPLAQLITLPLLDANGALSMPFVLPAATPVGSWVTLQAAVVDLSAPLAFALTNGVQLTGQ